MHKGTIQYEQGHEVVPSSTFMKLMSLIDRIFEKERNLATSRFRFNFYIRLL